MVLTLEEVKNYLKVDFTDDDQVITDLIMFVESYIDKCTGVDYSKLSDTDKNLYKYLEYKMIYENYENQSEFIKGANNLSRSVVVNTILNKLSLVGDEDV